jgi:hypothetical protein
MGDSIGAKIEPTKAEEEAQAMSSRMQASTQKDLDVQPGREKLRDLRGVRTWPAAEQPLRPRSGL